MIRARFPRSLGQFTLLGPLGRGEQGELYLAASGPERLCVVRVLGSRPIGHLYRLIDLRHPNLVQPIGVGTAEGIAYVALELVEGRDLGALLERLTLTERRLPSAVALLVLQEVLIGLASVHCGSPPVIHGAIDPSQVLISWTGEVKLLGCGLGRIGGASSTAFRAPEQSAGGAPETTWDVWALGMLAWRMLAGKLPEVDVAVQGHLPPMTRRGGRPGGSGPWSVELEEVARKALAISPRERWPSAVEFSTALGALHPPVAEPVTLAKLLGELWPEEARREEAEHRALLKDLVWSESELQRAGTGWSDPEPSTQQEDEEDQPPVPSASPPSDPTMVAPPRLPVDAPVDREPSRTPLRFPQARATPIESSRRRERRATRNERRTSEEFFAERMFAPPPSEPRPARATSGSGEHEQQGANAFLRQVIASRYRLDKLIGRGGMGWVFEGEHIEIGKRVAIKILRPRYSNDAEQVQRFRSEARAASLIGHPNIIDIHDFGTTDQGNFFLVMELLHGADLAEVLQQETRLESDRAVHVSLQVCRALAAAHEAGIIHRDLKPGNIFLTQRDDNLDFVKVLDFGIATTMGEGAMRRLTSPGMAIGTPEYMAPEQAAGGVIDHRVDVYAVGAILYEMLTGTPPHGSGNALTVMQRKIAEMPLSPRQINPSVPEALADTVMAALERDPARRLGSMKHLEYDLTKVVKGRSSAVAAVIGLKRGALPEAWSDTPLSSSPTALIAIEPMVIAPTREPTPGRVTPLRATRATPITERNTEPIEVIGQPTRLLPQLQGIDGDDEDDVTDDQMPTIERLAETAPSRRPLLPTPSQEQTLVRRMPNAPSVFGRRGPWLWAVAALIGSTLLAATVWWIWQSPSTPPSFAAPLSLGESEAGTTPAPQAAASPSTLPPAVPVPDLAASRAAQITLLLERAQRAADSKHYLTPSGENLRELLRQIIVLDPANAAALKLRMLVIARLDMEAQRALQRKQLDQADENYRTAIALDPDDRSIRARLVMTLCLRAEQSLKRRQVKTALEEATAATQFAPQDIGALITLGNAYLAADRAAQAAVQFRRVLELNPSRRDIQERLTRLEQQLARKGRTAAP